MEKNNTGNNLSSDEEGFTYSGSGSPFEDESNFIYSNSDHSVPVSIFKEQSPDEIKNDDFEKTKVFTINTHSVKPGKSAEKKKEEKSVRKKQTFLQGAAVLGISVIIVKIMGMVYKILLANVLNGVGSGILSTTYEVYNVLFVLATAGFPIAISRMVSENMAQNRFKDVKRIHKVSVPIFICSGILCFMLMLFGGAFYAENIVHSHELVLPIMMLAPCIFLGCLTSIYRGYFEGMSNMVPTAISEILEASGKLFVGLGLAYIVSAMGTNEYEESGTLFGQTMSDDMMFQNTIASYTVAAAIVGIVVGALTCFLFLLLRYKIKGDGIRKLELQNSPEPLSSRTLSKRLIMTAIPIGLGSIIMSLASFIDNTMVLTRIGDIMNTQPDVLRDIYSFVSDADINIFYTDKVPLYLNGCYSYSLTLMMLITSITQVFGTSALPSITTAWTHKDKPNIKRSIEMVLRTTVLFTVPAGLGLSVLAGPLLRLIYSGSALVDEVRIATPILQVMGISVIFIATSTPICSMLQAVGRADLPLKLLSVGMVLKIALNYILVGIPNINIQGATVGSLVAYLFITAVGIYLLCKETKIIPNFVTVLVRPLFAAVTSAVFAALSYNLFNMVIPSKISVVLAILTAVIIYIMALFLFKAIAKEDIEILPKGNKIAKVLEKRHLIR